MPALPPMPWPDPPLGEEHVDGCLCDIEIADEEVTEDDELPPAEGGIGED